jgi:tagaturonate reductase
MILSLNNLQEITPKADLVLPTAETLALPEKVLQFGTGVLLRGLPDYFIDKANKQGVFKGRIVVVKSTGNPGDEFSSQDNLYTLCVRGIENGVKTNQYIINSAISRVLSARDAWQDVIQCATNKEITIVISNTTEIGISLNEQDKVTGNMVPESFPGKLTACLYQRYLAFNGAMEAGWVILPTELITGNGTKLKAICIRLAELNQLEPAFINWLQEANDFCDTLVDCIVPGPLAQHEARKAAEYLGYEDHLMIMSEVYRLWAIETSKPGTKMLLSFAQADDSVIIADNIEKFRDLKLRLLNGAHTFSCGLALLSGFDTVKEAMHNSFFEKFIEDLMINEIAPTLTGNNLTEEEAVRFSRSVLDRFRNPHIEHRWESISKQYTAKMSMRNIPTLMTYYKKYGKVPNSMALGFAAYLYFMRSTQTDTGTYSRNCFGKQIPIEDTHVHLLHQYWNSPDYKETVKKILSDTALWKTDLSQLKGFEEAVLKNIDKLKTPTRMTHNSAIA